MQQYQQEHPLLELFRYLPLSYNVPLELQSFVQQCVVEALQSELQTYRQ